MASDADMSGWTGLLHSSSKLIEQATPSAQFPPLQRNLDQLEALSKKLKAKTLRSEAPSQSIAATRLLAREGLNAEQLARDLKSFEIKTTFEDVFPAEATTVEEYLQQVHEMAMLSAVQEAQKDNLRSFNDYMMSVLQEDWQKEKRDFLQSLSRISVLPRTNIRDSSSGISRQGQIVSVISSPEISYGSPSVELALLADKPVVEKKAAAYAEVVKNLNSARQHGLPFKPAAAFRNAYESMKLDSSGAKSVSMLKIWHLIMTLMGEDPTVKRAVSKRMSLVIGARRHLEWGHEKYVMDMIHSHPAQAALGGSVGNLHRIHAFLRMRLRDYGVLDFDASDARRQPPVDTTWQQIYFCLRTGYYDDALGVARTSRVSQQFTSLLSEWITTGGMVSAETAAAASEECEKILRMVDRVGRPSYDKKKLLLHAIISGSRRLIDRLLRELPTIFNTIEDFLWFMLSAVRESSGGSSSVVLNGGVSSYSLEDLQAYLNKFEPSYYTKNGKDPLVYPYVLLLSIQLLPGVLHLSKDIGDDGYSVDSVHISIVLADYGVLSEGSGSGQKLGVMDALAEASSIIRQYGAAYLRHGDLLMALEYYVQAAAAVGGGQLSWIGRASVDQQRQRTLMLKQLLTEILLRDGGISLLLGSRGAGEEGELGRFLTDGKTRQQFLFEAARQCQDAGLYDKSIEIQKRIGAFSAALDTINKCLSEALCALSRGRLDGESRITGLVHSGNELLETFKYYPEISHQERAGVIEQQNVLRQLEAILAIHKLARSGNQLDALREIARLPFLPLDPRSADFAADVFQNVSPHVEACVPGLLKDALNCLDNVTDTDGSLRAMRAKIANFLANNLNRNWPRDLFKLSRLFLCSRIFFEGVRLLEELQRLRAAVAPINFLIPQFDRPGRRRRLRDSEGFVDDSIDDELCFASGDLPKLQFRYLAESGALDILNVDDTLLLLSDMYTKVAEDKDKYGCSWESFEVYRHLKFLGLSFLYYMPNNLVRPDGFGRAAESGYPMVGPRGCHPEVGLGVGCHPECAIHGRQFHTFRVATRSVPFMDTAVSDRGSVDGSFIAEMFGNLHLGGMKPMFDVFPPNSKFKKSSPGNPSFMLCLASGYPPSKQEIEDLETRCGGIPLKFYLVEHGRVSFLSFIKVKLPVLP
ncbi:Nucleoporin interacting component family protein [Perilla frutescens var. frutescens]|nr:Nucleoporin interacting component family protein [Perilla frutescens var. frutescens]